MNRGLYNSLLHHDAYKNASKHWIVELVQSSMYWYELLVNPPGEFDTKKQITQALFDLKKTVEENLEKRFIYFIASRRRVRFSETRKPNYSFGGFGNRLNIYLEVGREKKLVKASITLLDALTKKPSKPKVETTDKFIRLTNESGDVLLFSIYDFLQYFDIELGHCTTVHYVGYTKNPHTRPIGGDHTGLNEILYRVPNEENDFFIYYNLFKVTSYGEHAESKITFHVANSMTDEVQVDKEGLILEKCLILYFGSANQTKNRLNEKAELENSLITLSEANNINAITFDFELEIPSEQFRFGSSIVEPSDRHVFSYTINQGKLQLDRSSKIFDDLLNLQSKESMGSDSIDPIW